jgi:hypothetical protein
MSSHRHADFKSRFHVSDRLYSFPRMTLKLFLLVLCRALGSLSWGRPGQWSCLFKVLKEAFNCDTKKRKEDQGLHFSSGPG